MNSELLDLWPAERAALPWGGQSPRALAQVVVQRKIDEFRKATCVVDNSEVGCPSREALRISDEIYTDAAQLCVCIHSFR